MPASPAHELTPLDQTCPRCGQPNRCAIAIGAPADSCWCMQEPPDSFHAPESKAAGSQAAPTVCYCQACLRALRAQSTS
ncbi:MAG: cysteine-rich CWC family protein [Brachymonas denitrificans]|uniref:cysteine-rich CWC family protein n=1 Tax=Brachymonas denitrificans TaxID=28220 RepID=UPI001BCC7C6D|nr:cysteine-rich CWC family protein [Brachymonas denitrificans]